MRKDFSKIYAQYKGLWVALDKDGKKVLSSGKNAKIVFKEAKNKGIKTPFLLKVPREIIGYVGSNI